MTSPIGPVMKGDGMGWGEDDGIWVSYDFFYVYFYIM